jgi:transposase
MHLKVTLLKLLKLIAVTYDAFSGHQSRGTIQSGGVRMERVPKALYTKEFKEEAVKMVTEGRLSIPEVGRRLSVPVSTITYWIKLAKASMLSGNSKQKPVTGEQMEVARLKREITELKMERDILKKAAMYFAKESLPGTRS